MGIQTKAIIAEIDAILARYEEVENEYVEHYKPDYNDESINYIKAPEYVAGEIISLLQETINRLAPVPNYGARALEHLSSGKSEWIRALAGVLKALRSDYEAGRIQNLQERIRS